MENLFDHLKRITLKDSLELKMEAENGEWGENELLELMYRYQRYHSIVEEQAYVIRGSVLSCEYGTREVRMDCTEDHGVYVGIAPLMTCGDCQHTNIHEFGSCMCPESNYAGRLPMTPGFFMDGSTAEKALGNNQAHICRPLINLEQGWQQIDEDLLVESHAHMTEPALLSNAVLVCQYGGVISINEVADGDEEVEEEERTLEWIPKFMDLEGSTDGEMRLKEQIESLNDALEEKGSDEALKWDQYKIDRLCEECLDYYEKYGIQIDPRLMIAIVLNERTGSFDTSSVNLGGDGQHGVEDNFETDLIKAIDLVGGKAIAYAYYVNDFSTAREKAYEAGFIDRDYDDFLHYLNWGTPRLGLLGNNCESRAYALNVSWNTGVRLFYYVLGYDGITRDYTDYLVSLGGDRFVETANEKGIVIPTVHFTAIQNGTDHEGNLDGRYSVIGISE